MVERKLYKTKLCVLYQRGRCNRQTCSFAHGDAELRRFGGGGSRDGRRDLRGGDLRDKIGRRYSPRKRYSPVRDARNRPAFHGYGPSRSPEDHNRRHRKKQHLDGQSDVSGDPKFSDAAADHVDGRKSSMSNSNHLLREQLNEVKLDLSLLEQQKADIESYLEERVQEADSLASKIQELEDQLHKEKKECKRITSRIKKFIKAHNRHIRLQDELKRSETQLQIMGRQLGLEVMEVTANDEDSSINIASDAETDGYHDGSPRIELQTGVSPVKKMLNVNPVGATGLQQHENLKVSQRDARSQPNNGKEAVLDVQKNSPKPSGGMGKQIRDRNVSSSALLPDKLKGSVYGTVLPSTGMAAHAADEIVDIEEENIEIAEPASIKSGVDESKRPPLSISQLSPIKKSSHSQYRGEDLNVALVSLEEDTMITDDVDIV